MPHGCVQYGELPWIVVCAVGLDDALCQFVPRFVRTSNQYLDADSVPLVHEVAATPPAIKPYPLIDDVVESYTE